MDIRTATGALVLFVTFSICEQLPRIAVTLAYLSAIILYAGERKENL